LATTGGFILTIGTLNFHVDGVGISRLLPAVEIITPAVNSASPSLTDTSQTYL
jgi:hypothetical protein